MSTKIEPANQRPTIESLALRLENGMLSAESLVEDAFARYDEQGDKHLFVSTLREDAMRRAREIDELRARSVHPSRFAGIPITIKDLFDYEGLVTTAGSKILLDKPVARSTAPAIARLLEAGFIVLGKVNMTEFAYSGLGLNPHYGTPTNPCSPSGDRIPGGSSSGSAVSVASGLVAASIGTDTGGSVRIPSSLCHLTGFKPGSESIDKSGVVPLALTLDTVGPLCNSVACCAFLYQLMSAEPFYQKSTGRNDRAASVEVAPAKAASVKAVAVRARKLSGLKILAPQNVVYEEAETTVISRTQAALQMLEASGAEAERVDIALLDDIMASAVQGTIAGYESNQWHRELLSENPSAYDPRVLKRLISGSRIGEQDYLQALAALDVFRFNFAQIMKDYDTVIWPTTARTAPRFSELEADSDYDRINLLLLRNTALGNVLNLASVSLPMTTLADGIPCLPAGLMVSRPAGDEVEVLEIATAIEACLGAA